MSELAGFLLARIAEDERAGAGVHHVDCTLFAYSDDSVGGWCDCGWPDRIKVECEAKRRIVEDYVHLSTMRPGALLSHAEFVTRALALPYAGHPDYRQEWRP